MNTPDAIPPAKPSSAVKPEVEKWMWDAANDIDHDFGLARFDGAISHVAELIASRYAAAHPKPSTGQAGLDNDHPRP